MLCCVWGVKSHLVEVLGGGEGGGSPDLMGCNYGHPTQHIGHVGIVLHIQLARLLKEHQPTHDSVNELGEKFPKSRERAGLMQN